MLEIPKVKIGPIGLRTLEEPTDKEYLAIGEELHSAFVSCGFVYLLDHGVTEGAISDVFRSSAKFFNKPLEEKKLGFPRDPETTQGYVEPGQEMLDELKEEAGEKAKYEIRETMDIVNLSSASPFPDQLVPGARSHFVSIGDQFKRLCRRVLQSLALSLKLDKNFFLECHQHLLQPRNFSKLRSLYYPPIKRAVEPGTIRCGEHSDYGSLTFLLQDDLGGLEVKTAEQQWIVATPIKGSILVNVGDMLEVFTNGLFPATRHRVVVPKEELIRNQPRQSFVFFIHPDDDTTVKPIHGEEPKRDKYKPVGAAEYTLRQFAKTYV